MAAGLNPLLDRLDAYPFARLRALLADLTPGSGQGLDLAIGEPKAPPPAWAVAKLAAEPADWGRYAPIDGTADFRAACAEWLARRFPLAAPIDPDASILPVAGTREGLFQAAMVTKQGGRIALPDPGYAVYEGAATMIGATPLFLPASGDTQWLPDLDRLEEALGDGPPLRAVYLCSPANPQGIAAPIDYWRRAITLCRQAGAILVADECYAALYFDTPTPGVLEAADGDLTGILSFHSLSKRSNMAGLRSGFVVGDPALIAPFRKLRSYSAAGSPFPILAVAADLWRDEAHVVANRMRYSEVRARAVAALGDAFSYPMPDGGFFLWLDVGDGEAACRRLWSEAGIRSLPGTYLTHQRGEADRYLRLALVHGPDAVGESMARIRAILG